MNLNVMRAIDRFAGIPLTFLLTWFGRLRQLGRRRAVCQPKNLLFIELSEMGSAILADPAMRLAGSWPGTQLHFVIFGSNKASLDLLGTVPQENIFCIDASGFGRLTKTTLQFLRWCRRKNIDTVIDLELFSRFTALLTGSSGARNRVGFHAFHNEGLYRGDLLTHKVAYNPFQHIAKNFVALVHALQQDPEQVPLLKRVIADEEVQLARATVSVDQRALVLQAIARRVPAFRSAETRVILVNANSSDLLPQRRWPRAYFAEAIRALLAWDARILVLLTGSPGEAAEADDLARGIADPRCVSFAGAIAFEQLPHLYSVSECMLTNDSGPGHFAAITAMHTFVIFGPETPALYGSLGSTTPIYAGMACSPCVSAANHRRTPCRDNRCVQVITPSSVVQTMCAWLADRSAPEEALAVREIPRGTPGTRIPAAEGHPIARE